MKAIKINATNDKGEVNNRVLEVAECLRGSQTCIGELVGLNPYESDFKFIMGDGTDRAREITLPLDTLKVCPFMCLKYGINLLVDAGFGVFHKCGIISIEEGEELYQYVIKCRDILGNEFVINSDEIQIDPEKLQKTEGIEVIEL